MNRYVEIGTANGTTPAKFRVKIAGDNVFVGGRIWCVNLVKKTADTGYLIFLETKRGGCEITERVIRGEDTVQMVMLAFTIFRDTFPTVTKIDLLDDSGFECLLPDGSKRKISLMLSNILFRGGTWYEIHFGAVMKNPVAYAEYLSKKASSTKKEDFSFNNPELDAILQPIYKESATWHEFMTRIADRWKENKCQIIYPWYKYAIRDIFDEMPSQEWVIDITRLERITYHMGTKCGGSRKRNRTTTSRRKCWTTQFEEGDFVGWDLSDIYWMGGWGG